MARNTVRQAMGELARDGLIHRVPGKGTFVDEKVRQRLKRGIEVFAMITLDTGTAFYPSLLDGFESATSGLGHQMLIGHSRNDLNIQARIILELLDKHVAGVAIVPVGYPTPPYQIRQLHERGIPVVFCHRPVEGIQAPTLVLSFREEGRVAAEAIVGRGHLRVALFTFDIAGPQSICPQMLTENFRATVQAAGGEVPDEFTCALRFSSEELGEREEEVFEALQRVCCRPDRPTAIMTSSDNLAELLFLQLGRLGLRVPEDISLVGFGGADRQGAIIRQLASVTVDQHSVGRRAAELLHEMRLGDRPINDNERIVIPLGFAEGRTLGPPPSELRIPERLALELPALGGTGAID